MPTINIIEKNEAMEELSSLTIDTNEISYIKCKYPLVEKEEKKENRFGLSNVGEDFPSLSITTMRSEVLDFGENPTVYKIGDGNELIITTNKLVAFEKAYMNLFSYMEEEKEEEEGEEKPEEGGDKNPETD